MKKTIYTAPQTEVVNVKVENLMQNASTGAISSENPTFGLGEGEELGNGGDNPGVFSRRRNVWDED